MREHNGKRVRACAAAAALAVAAVALLGHGGVLASPQCPVVRYDAQCTGWTDIHATYDPALEWTINTDSGTTPVIGQDGSLYLGYGSRSFRSYASDGTMRWTYSTPASIGGSAALGADGTAYVGLTGQLLALGSGGTAKWASPFRFTPGCAPSPTLVDQGGTLYFGADDKNVYAVNPDGTGKWSYTTGGTVRYGCAVSADGSTIYATSGDGRVYALNSSNGALRWKTAAISGSYNCAVAADGTIYVGSTSGKLYAFAPNGTQKWTFQSQSKVTCAPAIAPDGTIYFGSQDMNLYALDATGHLKWYYRTGGPIYSAPTLSGDGTVIFGAWPGILTALDPLNGSVEWTRSLTAGMYSAPIIDEAGSIYALCNNGALTKFSGPQAPEPCSLAALGGLLAVSGCVFRTRRRPAR
jgi:large repetitive protein